MVSLRPFPMQPRNGLQGKRILLQASLLIYKHFYRDHTT